MVDFVFGIENYCEIKYHGPDDHEWNYNWFSNKTVALKNGFDLDGIFQEKTEIFDPENHDIYYEVIYRGKSRYFSHINVGSYLFNKFSLFPYFRPINDLIDEDKNFLFVIDCGDYPTLDNVVLSGKVLEQIRKNRAKVILNTSYEPYSMEKEDFVIHLNNFANRFNLNYDNLKIISGNLKVQNDKNRRYEFIPYCYFFEHPWFIMKDAFFCDEFHDYRNEQINKEFEENKIKFIDSNRNIKSFWKTVLCYNRRAHPHRRYLFHELYTDDTIRLNSFISLNNGDRRRHILYDREFGTNEEHSNRINQFYDENTHNWVFDGENLDINLATDFNSVYHKNTFVSLVSETTTSDEIVFFSEKMFKPIYACQPFILSASRGSLTKLKEFGFKTFDRWWDESYDNEWTFSGRVDKIKKILYDLISKSDEEKVRMLQEMEEILVHNYELFTKTNNKYFFKTFNSIEF